MPIRPFYGMSKIIFACLFLGSVIPSYSQLLSIGIKGGVPLNDALRGYSSNGGSISTGTERWLVGPTVELHLPFRLSIEVDALYRRQSYQVSTTSTSGTATVSQWFNVAPTTITTNFSRSLNDLQFPFLAKYDLHGGFIRPFIDGGVTYRHLSGGGVINNPNMVGVTVGGGLSLKFLSLRLSPELRYTRWGNNNVYAPYVTGSQNQADVLVGFVF